MKILPSQNLAAAAVKVQNAEGAASPAQNGKRVTKGQLKRQKQLANAQAKADEAELEEQRRAVEEQKVKAYATLLFAMENKFLQGFNLKLTTKVKTLYLQDKTGLSVDFGAMEGKLSSIQIGQSKAWRRLRTVNTAFEWVEMHRAAMKGYKFPTTSTVPQQFAANLYGTPYEDEKLLPKGFEKVHVCFMPKMVVINDDETASKTSVVFQIFEEKCSGNRKHPIENYLAACDICPGYINRIDDLLESKMRKFIYQLFEEIRKDGLTANGALNQVLKKYSVTLIEIEKAVNGESSSITQCKSDSKHERHKLESLKKLREEGPTIKKKIFEVLTGMKSSVQRVESSILKQSIV